MIDHVRLKNFKCFRDETIGFGGLTILAGLNGAGKSSVIQAVLALRQRWGPIPVSPWRGSLVNLGRFSDVRHDDALDDAVRLEASFFEGKGRACLEVDPHQHGGESKATGIDFGAEPWFPGDVVAVRSDGLRKFCFICLPIGLDRDLPCHTWKKDTPRLHLWGRVGSMCSGI